MEPGESMTIPVVLQRMAWNPPKGLTLTDCLRPIHQSTH